MPELIVPTTRLWASWLAARDEWSADQPRTGLHDTDEVDTAEGFAAWVDRLRGQAAEPGPDEPGRVPATYWWIVQDDVYVGAITLRHRLNDFLLRAGGHVGYEVRPSARGRGLATWALGAVVARARERGVGRLLVTCTDDNTASARTIERVGGVLEDVRVTELGRTRRYWVEVPAGPAPAAGSGVPAGDRGRRVRPGSRSCRGR